MCRRGGGEIGIDQDVDDGPAAGADPPDQRGDGGHCRTTVSGQRGDRRIRDGQSAERENGERACGIELSRVFGRDGQHLERGGRGRYHLVGALGAECLGGYVEHGGDREE